MVNKTSNDWIQTRYLWYGKRPLCQLRHNHCSTNYAASVILNPHFLFTFSYLSCVSQTMKKLQPFGDVPKQLTEQLRRSFVATRTFAQSLIEGKQILNKILKVTLYHNSSGTALLYNFVPFMPCH